LLLSKLVPLTKIAQKFRSLPPEWLAGLAYPALIWAYLPNLPPRIEGREGNDII